MNNILSKLKNDGYILIDMNNPDVITLIEKLYEQLLPYGYCIRYAQPIKGQSEPGDRFEAVRVEKLIDESNLLNNTISKLLM